MTVVRRERSGQADERQELPVDTGATDKANELPLAASAGQNTQGRQCEWKTSLNLHVNYVA